MFADDTSVFAEAVITVIGNNVLIFLFGLIS